MRILYFHQHFSTPSGATGLRSYQMARYLVSTGHHVTMVCGSYGVGNTGLTAEFSRGKREGVVDGIRVIEFNLAYSNNDGLLKRTLSFIRYAVSSVTIAVTASYDIVFATSTPLTAGIPGIAAKVLRRKPFIFEVRDLWPELPREMGVIKNKAVLGAMSILEWASYRAADRCIGLSPGIVKGIERRGIKPANIRMIPNGCDLETFDPQLPGKWRPAEVAPTDFMAVFTGTHGIANGLDSVLDAAAELKNRGIQDIKLVMIGHGKLKPRLIQRAKDESLDNCVFLDSVPKSKLSNLLRSADLGLMILANIPAFYFGTSPNKFFDYLAAGIPILNNYPGWLAGMISENEIGYIVPPDNADAFANALVTAKNDARIAPRKRAAARNLAVEEFSWPLLATDFEKTLLDAVGKDPN